MDAREILVSFMGVLVIVDNHSNSRVNVYKGSWLTLTFGSRNSDRVLLGTNEVVKVERMMICECFLYNIVLACE